MAYIPNTDADRRRMLDTIGVDSVDDLFSTIPASLRFDGTLPISGRLDQISLTRHATRLAASNVSSVDKPCFLGAGVYDHYVPPTVAAITGRSEFYTSYTPYQPEVSQGVLQSIFEFQTLICELTGMDVANASMYDGATALAEAALMAADLTGRKRIVFAGRITRNYRKVVETYIRHSGLALDVIPAPNGTMDLDAVAAAMTTETAAVIAQQPNFLGQIEDMPSVSRIAHEHGALLISVVDPISLGLLAPPGTYDADIVVAEGQSLGCPMGYGGPLLGIFACKNAFIRRLPGRIVGQTKDAGGKRAFVMTLRTREQDIRRERATSNICTNEALYALAACVYLATMGKRGLRQVAELCLQKAHYAAQRIAAVPGCSLAYPQTAFFKEFVVRLPAPSAQINAALIRRGFIGGYPLDDIIPELGPAMIVCVTEQRTREEIDSFAQALGEIGNKS
ncbi:MAG: aminomethyl-transferring glycine dehydrogenase subunit GcvPA [Capsulimonadaceae bacterium]